MKNAAERLSQLQFYPCKTSYEGCVPQRNYNFGDCGPSSHDRATQFQQKVNIGDCGLLE